MRSQPSSCVRKCQSLRCLPCETTSACTFAPSRSGAPSFTSAPSPTSNTSRSNFAPTSCASFSTLRRSPSLTRYCLPPVLTTAYIFDSVLFLSWRDPAGREIPPPGAERNGRSSGFWLPSQAQYLDRGALTPANGDTWSAPGGLVAALLSVDPLRFRCSLLGRPARHRPRRSRFRSPCPGRGTSRL